jgi:hypothetical protein
MKRVRVKVIDDADVEVLAPQKKRRGNPAFIKGQPLPDYVKPKPKGARNKVSVILKECMLAAMDMVGQDGKGKHEATGYLAWLAREKPEIFGRLLEKLLPFTLTGAGGGPVQLQYSNTADVIQRMKERNLPIPKSLMAPSAASANGSEAEH